MVEDQVHDIHVWFYMGKNVEGGGGRWGRHPSNINCPHADMSTTYKLGIENLKDTKNGLKILQHVMIILEINT